MTSRDDALIAAMTTTITSVRSIAQRVDRPIMDVERDLYRLAGIRPGQLQAPKTGRVRNYRSRPGIPVAWSLPRLRLLVTGSREWTDRPAMRSALVEVQTEWGVPAAAVTVVHGKQGTYKNGVLVKGADMIADEEAKALGMLTDPHPADWRGPCDQLCNHGPRRVLGPGRTICQHAGYRRNQAMVDTQPDECVGFPIGQSSGTRDCMRRTEAAGIPVRNRGQHAA